MLHTNFIAARASAARQAVTAWRTARRTTIAAGCVAILVPLLLANVVSSRASRLREVKQERLALAESTAKHAALTAEIVRLKAPSEIAAASHFNDALWHDLLRELRDRLPAGLWLTGVEVAPAVGETVGQRLTIEGQAEDHEAIGAFVAALTGSPWLATAQLRESEPVEGSQAPYAFSLEAVLRRALVAPPPPGVRS